MNLNQPFCASPLSVEILSELQFTYSSGCFSSPDEFSEAAERGCFSLVKRLYGGKVDFWLRNVNDEARKIV